MVELGMLQKDGKPIMRLEGITDMHPSPSPMRRTPDCYVKRRPTMAQDIPGQVT